MVTFRRVARVALLVAAVAGFLLLLAGVAFADDCSSPSDCSNTAWTVGGGAAVAGGLAAAAAASGLLPGSPEGATNADGTQNPLSPECQEKLQALLDRVNDQFAYLAELTVTARGAIDRATEGRITFQNLQRNVPDMPMPSGADVVGVASGVGDEVAGSMFPAATAVQGAQAAASTAQRNLASAASRLASSRSLVQGWERLLSTIDTSTPAGAARYLEVAEQAAAASARTRAAEVAHQQARSAASQAAQRAQQMASQAAGINGWRIAGGVAKGAGAMAALWSAYQTKQTLDRFRGDMRVRASEGAVAAEANIRLAELQRWNSYVGELKVRHDEAVAELNRRIAAYNTAAGPCGAALLSADATTILDVAQAGPRATGRAGPVPGRVIDPRPRELAEQGTPQDCNDYEAALRQYEQVARSVGDDLYRWRQRAADLPMVKNALDRTIADHEFVLTDPRFQYQAAHVGAGGVTIGAALLGLAGMITLGPALAVGAVVFAVTVGAEVGVRPAAEQVERALAIWRRERQWLDSRDGYVHGEINRLQRMVATDLRQRHDELVRLHARCTTAGGSPLPPTPPDLLTRTPPIVGVVRTLQEVRQWR